MFFQFILFVSAGPLLKWALLRFNEKVQHIRRQSSCWRKRPGFPIWNFNKQLNILVQYQEYKGLLKIIASLLDISSTHHHSLPLLPWYTHICTAEEDLEGGWTQEDLGADLEGNHLVIVSHSRLHLGTMPKVVLKSMGAMKQKAWIQVSVFSLPYVWFGENNLSKPHYTIGIRIRIRISFSWNFCEY